MDLKLPFSVIRNEQVQIQAVLYNFGNRQVKVKPPALPFLPKHLSVCFIKGMGCVVIQKGQKSGGPFEKLLRYFLIETSQ